MKQPKILIAEDDELLLNILQQIFKENAFKVFTVDNGLSALEQYRTHSPNVILTDIDMPEKNGWEVLDQIRKENKIIPIVVMSGNKIRESDSLKSYDMGATFFIRKPFGNKEMVAIIHAAMQSAYGTDDIVVFGNYQLNKSFLLLKTECSEHRLTEKEINVLNILVKNQNHLVETDNIITDVWHNIKVPSNYQALRNVVSKLNKIFNTDKQIRIKSVYSKGYSLQLQV